MEISEKEYNELKLKASKWDALDVKLAEIYNEDYDVDQEVDLCDIGEIAATAFGYL